LAFGAARITMGCVEVGRAGGQADSDTAWYKGPEAVQTWRWKFSLVAAAALAASVMFVAAVRADDLSSTVAERQAGMKAMGSKLKAIKAFADSGTGQAEAADAAAQLVATSKSIPGWFPVGSGLDSLPGKTAAKPEIWSEQEKFKTIAATFQTDAFALQQAIAAGDKGGATMAFDAMGREGCGACHGAFRAKT
jgi:cytochrome c556